MAAMTFPSSPTLNQTYTVSDKTWYWDGSAWAIKSVVVVGPQGPAGTNGSPGAQGIPGEQAFNSFMTMGA